MKQCEKKQFVQAIFCAPTGAYEDKGYVSRLTDEVFSALKEAGINRLFAFGYDDRAETRERTFELCDKYDIKYFPVPRIKGAYTRVLPGPNGEKPYLDMSETERLELDRRLLEEVEVMRRHPAFGGIFFTDEAGYLSQEGTARAKKVFDTAYGNYEFHVNLFNYCVDDAGFWGGFGKNAPAQVPFPLEGDLALAFENRFHRYDLIVEKLLSGASFEYISQDLYPFENFWPTVPTSVHVGLFELNGYFNEKKKKYGSKFYNYMQVGHWVDCKTRSMSFAEMTLQMHVTAAYGSEGFAYFPGCFPLDWANLDARKNAARGGSSLIDLDGNKTKFCEWLMEINTYFREIEDDILSSEHLGVETYGVYKNGFSEEEISTLRDNECIYRGNLPDMLRYQSGLKIENNNQVLVATFVREEKKRYYIVNLSTVYENPITVHLGSNKFRMTGLNQKYMVAGDVQLALDAGAGIYLQEI